MKALLVLSYFAFKLCSVVQYIWVDNSDIVGSVLKDIFPTATIMEDSTHLMRRYMKTLSGDHPMNGTLLHNVLVHAFHQTTLGMLSVRFLYGFCSNLIHYTAFSDQPVDCRELHGKAECCLL